jgi:hypothetical protein
MSEEQGFDGTVETATVVEAGEPTTSGVSGQPLDLSQYGDHLVTVKVNGEERQVPLAEAVNGFMMQSDYTRKSQELAESRRKAAQAEAIWDAIQRDPTNTIGLLAEEFGVNFGTRSNDMDDLDDDGALIAPLEAKIRQLEQREQRRELDRQLANLRDRYGDFDEDDLLSFAMKEGIQSVEAAYKAMTFEKVMREREELARRQAKESEAVEAKRAASFVEGASTRANVAPKGDQPGRAKSIRDAFLRAKQELSV